MSETPHNFEINDQEDVYEKVGLGDAVNELYKVYVHQVDGKWEIDPLLPYQPLLTLEKRYAARGNVEGISDILKIIEAHPKKVERYDAIIALMNQNIQGEKDPILHMRCCNEIVRLVQGKDRRMFDEDIADPNFLEL